MDNEERFTGGIARRYSVEMRFRPVSVFTSDIAVYLCIDHSGLVIREHPRKRFGCQATGEL
jgi:hypothetical protein